MIWKLFLSPRSRPACLPMSLAFICIICTNPWADCRVMPLGLDRPTLACKLFSWHETHAQSLWRPPMHGVEFMKLLERWLGVTARVPENTILKTCFGYSSFRLALCGSHTCLSPAPSPAPAGLLAQAFPSMWSNEALTWHLQCLSSTSHYPNSAKQIIFLRICPL